MSVFQGARYHRVNYRRELEPLLQYYGARFVGREPPLSLLVEHVERGAGYLFVRAPAARGKTSLLARLVDQVSGQVPVLTHFLRPGAGQHTSTAMLQSLNSQLLDLLGLGGGVAPTLAELRPQFSELWSVASQDPLALVIDGLDEMAHEEIQGVQLLPAGLGSARVVVSSRPLPDPRNAVPPEHPLRFAELYDLEPLDLEETRRLLNCFIPPADVFPEWVRRLHMISNGEPLVASFLAEGVAAQGEAALSDAAGTSPSGVEKYFQHQVSVLRVEAPDPAWDLLGVLSVAVAPMRPEDVALLTGRARRVVMPAWHHIDRYLIRAGNDEVAIAHPALQQQLAAEFSDDERDALVGSLQTWARSFRDAGWPPETPTWLLQNWSRQLAKDAPAALVELIDRPWVKARMNADEEVTRGALADAEAALAAADTETSRLRLAFLIATLGDLDQRAPGDALEVMSLCGQEALPTRLAGAAPRGSVRRATLLAHIGRGRLLRGDRDAAEAAFLEAAAPARRSAMSVDDYADIGILAENAGGAALRRLADSVLDGTLGDGPNQRPEVLYQVLAGLTRVGEHDRVRACLREWPDLPAAAVLWGTMGDIEELEELERRTVLELPGWLEETLANLPPWFRTEETSALDLSALAQGWANAGRAHRASRVAARISTRTGDLIQSSLLLTGSSLVKARSETAVRGLAALEGRNSDYTRSAELRHLGRALEPLGDISLLARAEAIANSGPLGTDVCLAWAMSGEPDRGLALVENEVRQYGQASWLRRDVLLATLREGARAGSADRAEAVARSIRDPLMRSHGVAAVALGVVHDDRDRGLRLADESTRINLEMRPTAHTIEIIELATAVARLTPDSPACEQLAQRCLDTDARGLEAGRSELAELLVAVGRLGSAHNILKSATSSAWPRRDSSRALSRLARAYVERSERAPAVEAATMAEAELPDYRWDSPVWIELAKTWRLLGHTSSSARCFDKAMSACRRISEEGHWSEWTAIVEVVDEALARGEQADATNSVKQLLHLGWPSTVAAAALLSDDRLRSDSARQVASHLQDDGLRMEWLPAGVHHLPAVLQALHPEIRVQLGRALDARADSDPDPRHGARLRLVAAYAFLETDPANAAKAGVRALVDSRIGGASEHLLLSRRAVPLLARTRPGLLETHLWAIYDVRSWWSDWP